MREQKVVARRQCEKPQHKLGIWWKTTDLVPGFWKTGPDFRHWDLCRVSEGGEERERERGRGREREGRRERGRGREVGREEGGRGRGGRREAVGKWEGGKGRRVGRDRGGGTEKKREKLRQSRENPKANINTRIQEPCPILYHVEEESRMGKAGVSLGAKSSPLPVSGQSKVQAVNSFYIFKWLGGKNEKESDSS